jgi:Tfp pilus assembly protein PilF
MGKTITICQHAVLFDPRNADVRKDIDEAYRNSGLPDQAFAEYRTALECNERYMTVRYNLGTVYA